MIFLCPYKQEARKYQAFPEISYDFSYVHTNKKLGNTWHFLRFPMIFLCPYKQEARKYQAFPEIAYDFPIKKLRNTKHFCGFPMIFLCPYKQKAWKYLAFRMISCRFQSFSCCEPCTDAAESYCLSRWTPTADKLEKTLPLPAFR